ncbi:hypothetical protein HYH03_012875 [Edaphochlamys debaryana]|uniref:Uncharacterized protein n=1 Tax=Edaphochlamys debaryana TaxID=47281 RepID=A0A835XUJ5_9CHLO|nr:hypothetical protein HYH03_012875 [Edaphochlamys debaryana]|eukprot:KAG2488556.1 hypothetical protein HYH03_012875 [Edaphochlamys debaryana]
MTTIVFTNSRPREPSDPAGLVPNNGINADGSERCSLAALNAHFPSGTLACRAREAASRATVERAPLEVELHLAFEPNALRAALHAYTTGSLQGAQLPESADLDWIQTEVIQKYGIPLGGAALLERRPKVTVGNTRAKAAGVGGALDAKLLRMYFQAKAEGAAKDIIAALTIDVAAIMESALFLVSKQAPSKPKEYEHEWRHGPEPDYDYNYYDTGVDAPAPDEAAPPLFVSRIAGSGAPAAVVNSGYTVDSAYGMCWVVDAYGDNMHANLLGGAVSRDVLQAVVTTLAKLQPTLKASVEAHEVQGDAPGGQEAHTAYLLRVSWPSAFGGEGMIED